MLVHVRPTILITWDLSDLRASVVQGFPSRQADWFPVQHPQWIFRSQMRLALLRALFAPCSLVHYQHQDLALKTHVSNHAVIFQEKLRSRNVWRSWPSVEAPKSRRRTGRKGRNIIKRPTLSFFLQEFLTSGSCLTWGFRMGHSDRRERLRWLTAQE